MASGSSVPPVAVWAKKNCSRNGPISSCAVAVTVGLFISPNCFPRQILCMEITITTHGGLMTTN